MVTFFIKRLLFYILSLPLLVVILLVLVTNSPEDPVDKLMRMGDHSPTPEMYDQLYRQTQVQYNLDLPLFYFHWKRNNQLTHSTFPNHQDIELATYFSKQGSSESSIVNYVKYLHAYTYSEKASKLTNREADILFQLRNFPNTTEVATIPPMDSLQYYHSTVIQSQSYANKFPPSFKWNGLENQFHQFFIGLFSGDWGISYVDQRPVKAKILRAFGYTLTLLVLTLIIAVPLSIFWGFVSTLYQEKWWVQVTEVLTYFFYAIPLFWLATLAVVFFTSQQYFDWGKIFILPRPYLFSQEQSSLYNVFHYFGQFILPVLCMTLHDIGIFSRQIKTLLNGESNKLYMTTAKMKGLSTFKQIRTHAFSNIRVQVLTMISGGITSFFAGSLVIEYIFNIPGVGRLTYDSLQSADIPTLIAIVVIIFTLITITYSITDFLYRKIDPKMIVD